MSSGYSSQATRFAALVDPETAVDPSQLTERLALFSEDGEPLPLVNLNKVEDWHILVAFENGWTSLSPGHELKYRKRPSGVVELKGYLKPGSPGLVFTLPEGYFPLGAGGAPGTFDQLFPVVADNQHYAQVGFRPDGEVWVISDISGFEWVNFSAIRYSAD
jgi:hypothetical protein